MSEQTTVTINPETQIKRFNESFQLEAETVGQSIRRRVSTKGAVRVDLMTKKDLGTALNLKGDALDAHIRTQAVGLKSEMAVGFSRLAANPEWVGKAITMNGKGDAITFHLKKVKPLVISQAKQVMTADEAIKTLGIPAEKQAEAIKALQELGFIEPQPQDEKPEDESETQPGQPAANGSVGKVGIEE